MALPRLLRPLVSRWAAIVALVASMSAAALALHEHSPAPPLDDDRWAHNLDRNYVPSAPRTVAAFLLHDHHGQPFAAADLHGHWTWLFFGYASCPDVCPMTLAAIPRALEALPAELRARTEVVFVSVDPQRDDGTRLAAYVEHFGPGIRGVTGTRAELDKLVDSVGASYQLGSSASDSVEHSTSIFVVDPYGRVTGTFLHATRSERLARDFGRVAGEDLNQRLTVSDAWIPVASPNSRVWAGYLTVHNHGDTPRGIVGASSSAFAGVQLHTTVIEHGRARMRALEHVPVPVDEAIAFEPGGRHLMLIDPTVSLHGGDVVPIVLHLDDGTRLSVSARVGPQGSGP